MVPREVVVLVVALAALVGVSLGLLGGGGSILTTPILLYAAGLPGKEAIASSLVVVGMTAGFSAWHHLRAGLVNPSIGLRFAGAAMVGSYIGGRLAGHFPTAVLLAAFVAVMALTGLMMLRPRPDPETPPAPRLLKLTLTALGVGLVTGLVGAGGGFVVVPALVLAGGLPMRMAIGTSLLVIALQSGAGFAGHLDHVQLDWRLLGWVTGSALAGSVAGARLARWMDPASLRRNFALFVLGMAAFMGIRLVPQPATPLILALAILLTAGVSLAAGFLLGRFHEPETS